MKLFHSLVVAILLGVLGLTTPVAAMPLDAAVTQVTSSFQSRMQRPLNGGEANAIITIAMERGWDGGAHIDDAIVDHILSLIREYTGRTIAEAMTEIEGQFQSRFNRSVLPDEWRMLAGEIQRQGYRSGNIPSTVWSRFRTVLDRYQPKVYTSDDEITIVGKKFYINGEEHPYVGITNFLLTYDDAMRPKQAEAFLDFCVMHNIRMPRVTVTTSAEWLLLTPRSGQPFGLGATRGHHPWNTPGFWDDIRGFIRKANSRGLTPEVVIYLLAGPESHSISMFRTEAGRLAFAEITARELLGERAILIEMANEYNQIGFALDGLEIVEMARRYKAIDPKRMVALSAPATHDQDLPINHVMAQGDYVTIHMSRDTKPYTFKWVLDMFFVWQHRLNKPIVNDESINADSSGEYGNDPDPRNSYAAGVMVQLLDMHYTYHYDRGLHGLVPDNSDNSWNTFQGWVDGMHDGQFDGTFFGASPSGALPGSPFATSGRSTAVVGKIAENEGLALFLGVAPNFVPPAAPGWTLTLVSDRGTHRLYSLSR